QALRRSSLGRDARQPVAGRRVPESDRGITCALGGASGASDRRRFPEGFRSSGARPPESGHGARALRLARAAPHRAYHQPARADGLVGRGMPTGKSTAAARRSGPDADHVAPEILVRKIEEYLAEHATAAVLEDGRVLFDMRSSRYSLTESHGRCLLQLWSDERNLMRTVVGVQERAQCLRLTTRRMGAAKPQSLELAPTSDRRTPTARDTARRNYLRLLERVLARGNIGSKVDGMRSAMDLE